MIFGRFKRPRSAGRRAHERDLSLPAAAFMRHDRVMHQLRQLIQFAGPAENIDMWMPLKNGLPIALGHAPDDADDEARIIFLAIAQLPKPRPDFLLACSRTEQVLKRITSAASRSATLS